MSSITSNIFSRYSHYQFKTIVHVYTNAIRSAENLHRLNDDSIKVDVESPRILHSLIVIITSGCGLSQVGSSSARCCQVMSHASGLITESNSEKRDPLSKFYVKNVDSQRSKKKTWCFMSFTSTPLACVKFYSVRQNLTPLDLFVTNLKPITGPGGIQAYSAIADSCLAQREIY